MSMGPDSSTPPLNYGIDTVREKAGVVWSVLRAAEPVGGVPSRPAEGHQGLADTAGAVRVRGVAVR